ncbi:hypothetical protein CSCA_1922 [Clostridium scatologenes]|uniref:Uncharacterized protein n=1 Tax=Clostridium scatologenes TaxID=1548 RepID=A0A0E3M7N8_CLOSL|nr:hypothetical protein CSCA_1922 [Clostridium scatologenes]
MRKSPRTPPYHQNPLPLPLRAKLARSRESSDRTARNPAPRNVCGMTGSRRPVMKKRTPRRTASVWRNQSSVWKKAAIS